ncbi:MAG: hypothetical protein BMS9Abin36_1698 [Gammaproteobacteria bacterium]|nr:MAG: hypothetical protein BMS9Abin36_1698 [Gammaproteobacteria bacterium]
MNHNIVLYEYIVRPIEKSYSIVYVGTPGAMSFPCRHSRNNPEGGPAEEKSK